MGMGNNKNKDLYFMKIRSKTDTNQRPHFKVEKASKDGKGQPMEAPMNGMAILSRPSKLS